MTYDDDNTNNLKECKATVKALKDKVAHQDELIKHGIEQQKKWQRLYFEMREKYEELQKHYKTLYDSTIENTRRKEREYVEANNRSND